MGLCATLIAFTCNLHIKTCFCVYLIANKWTCHVVGRKSTFIAAFKFAISYANRACNFVTQYFNVFMFQFEGALWDCDRSLLELIISFIFLHFRLNFEALLPQTAAWASRFMMTFICFILILCLNGTLYYK